TEIPEVSKKSEKDSPKVKKSAKLKTKKNSEILTQQTTSEFVSPKTEKFTCKVCGKKFKCKSGLYFHNNAHLAESSFECDDCKKLYPSKY
ncbi:hypothetical protein, partial [Faecalicatena contorta]|uniref:hypothetical protein n=1 Tax=Faecalicatena contorta TaxID=39482 RepID=UPI0019609D1B